jgi:hypothetical protein
MSSTLDWEELFDTQASEPVAWIEMARTLRLGAQPALARFQEIRDASPNEGHVRLEQLGCVRAYMLLTAAALENMFKAIAVRRGFITAAGGQLHHDGSVFPLNGHALKDMARSLQVELTPTDVDL